MKKTVFLLVLSIMMSSIHIPAVYAAGNVYYVDIKNGSDSNDGSISAPFKTLSKASKVIQAGDTCYIREGVYRETLNANVRASKDKTVTYKAFEGEDVVISGGDIVTGWTPYTDTIYQANVSFGINGGNIVFADGEMCHEARWPNKSGSFLDTDSYAKPESLTGSGTYTITNSDIPDISYSGAMIWYNTETAYWSRIASVTSGEEGKLTFNATNSSNIRPGSDSLFYVTRALGLLDEEYEWYKDEANDILYLWAPNGVDPDTMEIEVKKRETAIDISNASYVNIEGIKVRSADVLTNSNTTHCTLDGMVFDSIDYNLKNGESSCNAKGVRIAGSYNIIKNSEIKNNYGYGVTLSGNNNAVLNCDIHDINYQHIYSNGITVNGKNHIVRGNNIYNLGRSAIGGGPVACDISYNDIYDGMKLSKDGGLIYFANSDFGGTEVHHNLVHGVDGTLGGVQIGIYYDNSCTGLVTYNNVVYDIVTSGLASEAAPVMVNKASNYNVFFNNTLVGEYPVRTGGGTGGLAGNVFINNVFSNESWLESEADAEGIIYQNNIVTSGLNSDYTLPGGSAAINAGQIIPDITVSDTPDCGAYEYGEEKWTAGIGALVDEEYTPHYNIPGLNLLTENNQFESDYKGWTVESGNPEIAKQSSWNFSREITRQGERSAKLGKGDIISRKLSGLKPNTSYNVSIFGQIKGDFYSTADVSAKSQGLTTSNYKSSGIIANITDGAWIKFSDVDFKNGEFDKVKLQLNTIKKDDTFTIKLDSLDGTTIGTFVTSSNYTPTFWTNDTIATLSECTGVHDVYIEFTGEHEASFMGGFILMDTNTLDKAKAIALSDGNECTEEEITAASWEEVPSILNVTTGDLGEIEISIEKNEGTNFIYLDSVSVTECFDGMIESSKIKITNMKVVDMDNNIISAFDDFEANIVEFDVHNASAEEKKLTVESYTKTGEMFSGSEVNCKPGMQKISLGVRVPNEYGEYILIKAGDEINHRITLVDMGNQVLEDNDIYIKKLWVNNSTSQNNIKNGELNSVSMLIRNNTEQDKTGKIILAFYNENGALSNMVSKSSSLKAYSSNSVESDSITASAEAAYGRVFIWEGDTMRPLTEFFALD